MKEIKWVDVTSKDKSKVKYTNNYPKDNKNSKLAFIQKDEK